MQQQHCERVSKRSLVSLAYSFCATFLDCESVNVLISLMGGYIMTRRRYSVGVTLS